MVYPLGMFTIAFSGGGTGGHIYPGLAVISALQRELDCRVFWIGSSRGIDRSLVETAGIAFYGIPAGKLRRNFSLQNAGDFFKVAAGFFAAKKILKREKAALLFSKGGFVSVPPCAAAAFLGIPVVTHESDYSPGLATRLNARFAEKSGGRVITAYRETADRFSPRIRKNVLVLGNPVRSCFRHGDPEAGRAFLGAGKGDRILLVLGGSQGARELNRLVEASLSALGSFYLVAHQTGPAHEPAVQNTPRYKTYPYIRDEMPDVLAAAELVLCRSGAGTVWECATAGKPMILLPLAGSGTRGDQVENARFFENAGAAAVLSPERRGPEDLQALVKLLAADGEKRRSMAEASARIGAADGAGRIADLLRETLETMGTMEKSR